MSGQRRRLRCAGVAEAYDLGGLGQGVGDSEGGGAWVMVRGWGVGTAQDQSVGGNVIALTIRHLRSSTLCRHEKTSPEPTHSESCGRSFLSLAARRELFGIYL